MCSNRLQERHAAPAAAVRNRVLRCYCGCARVRQHQQCAAPVSAPLRLSLPALLDWGRQDSACGSILGAAPPRLQGAACGVSGASFRNAFSEPVGDFRGGDPGDDPLALLSKASSGVWLGGMLGGGRGAESDRR